jgi:2-polyprenyl-6-methoxyphenol hydroxylase-like FAD-dependent oxidoreductase
VGGLRALVVGGGIGGTTAGCALHRAGVEAAVFEQADDVRRIYVGSGIHLWNNTMRALAEVGLDRKVMDVSGPGAIVEHFDIYSHTGRLLASVPLERTRARIGAECVGINRAELLPALAEELPAGVLRLGKRCVGFEQTDGAVVARFGDGSEERGEVLIGADGAHSTIRRQLLGDGAPRYAGYTIWQGITNVRESIAPVGLFPILFGPGQRFAYYHVNEVRLYWFAVANAPEGGSEPAEERKAMLLERFRGWPAHIAEIIESTPVEATHRRDLYDREPDERWGEGRATLLGDAAHAMTFDLGQGAGQSIEDAVVLARCLADVADPAEALREYERRRMKRTAHMQKLSRFVGRTAAWEQPAAVRLREVAWRVVLGNRFFGRKLDNDLAYDF